MNERRKINRTQHISNSIIVICDTHQKIQAQTVDVSPLGMGITIPADSEIITGKDIVIVTQTMIMYADVVRQVKNPDGSWHIGIQAKQFTEAVLNYLFSTIGGGIDSSEV